MSPHIYDGTAGLILVLILFSTINNIDYYDDFILELSSTLNVKYSKNLSVLYGPSGIAFTNLILFRYLDDPYFLNTCLNLTKTLFVFAQEIDSHLYIRNPTEHEDDSSFTTGSLGILFVLQKIYVEAINHDLLSQEI